ncbi:MAG: hypothetical protein ACYS3S_20745, partial [Planctomycetota bacterium]
MSTKNIEQSRIVFCSKAPWLLVVTAGVLIFSMFGCGGEKRPTFLSGKQTPKTGQITKEELRKKLNNFEE